MARGRPRINRHRRRPLVNGSVIAVLASPADLVRRGGRACSATATRCPTAISVGSVRRPARPFGSRTSHDYPCRRCDWIRRRRPFEPLSIMRCFGRSSDPPLTTAFVGHPISRAQRCSNAFRWTPGCRWRRCWISGLTTTSRRCRTTQAGTRRRNDCRPYALYRSPPLPPNPIGPAPGSGSVNSGDRSRCLVNSVSPQRGHRRTPFSSSGTTASNTPCFRRTLSRLRPHPTPCPRLRRGYAYSTRIAASSACLRSGCERLAALSLQSNLLPDVEWLCNRS